MGRILLKQVIGGEIHPAPKPPNRPRLEIAIVQVYRRHIGVARMQHHRGACGVERMPCRFWTLFQNRRGQMGSEHLGKIDSPLLKHVSLLNDPRAPAPSSRAFPTVFPKLGFSV
jgi:hypothetical protein